jgi:hypothetical protein
MESPGHGSASAWSEHNERRSVRGQGQGKSCRQAVRLEAQELDQMPVCFTLLDQDTLSQALRLDRARRAVYAAQVLDVALRHMTE